MMSNANDVIRIALAEVGYREKASNDSLEDPQANAGKGNWTKYYARYSNIESIIYTSGGFASSATLSARGANYSNVSQRVKLAVWGATYGVTYYKNIANDYNIFFWSSSGYAVSSSKLGYSFKTPFGNYVNIWRQYWG